MPKFQYRDNNGTVEKSISEFTLSLTLLCSNIGIQSFFCHTHARTPAHMYACRHLEAVSVQVIRWPIGRGHHHGPFREQRLEQPLQEERVGNVRDLKLVEAQQPALGDQLPGDNLPTPQEGKRTPFERTHKRQPAVLKKEDRNRSTNRMQDDGFAAAMLICIW